MMERSGAQLERFKILSTREYPEDRNAGTPGAVRIEGDALLVACGSGWIAVIELQPEGRKRMKAADFLRGAGPLNLIRFA